MTTRILGNPEASTMLVQMIDDHDSEFITSEYLKISGSCPGRDFSLLTVKIDTWEDDLSPWPAPPVFGKTPFGNGASRTLSVLLDTILPQYASGQKSLYIGGYSLAGLFALWAGCNCSLFKGIAAASPSAWFPGFTDYCKANPPRTGAVYLSLGDKEEKTRNPVMATVGNAIRRLHSDLSDSGIPCTLEWNEGNHFRDSDMRMARGFAWLLNGK